MLSKTISLLLALLLSVSSSIIVEAAVLTQKRSDMRCPTNPGGAGLYPDPDDCSKYYYCTAGNPIPEVQRCHDNTMYSARLRRCVVSTRSDCPH